MHFAVYLRQKLLKTNLLVDYAAIFTFSDSAFLKTFLVHGANMFGVSRYLNYVIEISEKNSIYLFRDQL